MNLFAKIASFVGFRPKEPELISIVLHLRQQADLSEDLIRSAIARAWDRPMQEPLKETVVVRSQLCFVNYDGMVLMLTDVGRPYCPPEYLEEALAQFPEEPQKQVAREHKAFLTIDLLNPKNPNREQKQACYRQMARLAAELLDDNCLGIYVPETGYMRPNKGEILKALRSERPLIEIARA